MMFSIIIPTYNCENRLKPTIDSIINQRYSDYEIIVQDGESTDRTCDIVGGYIEKGIPIRFFSEQDAGIYDAMNRAVKAANGDFCLFLGAGDALFNDNVLSQFESIISLDEANSQKVDVYYGYVYQIDGDNETIYGPKIDFSYKLKFNPICHQAVFAKRDLLIKYPFDTIYKIAADQDWMMKLLKNGYKFSYVDIPVAKYLLDGYSSNNEKMFLSEQDRIHKTYYPGYRMIRRMWRRIVHKPL